MKRSHLFAFYCTLVVPLGALAGIAAGGATGHSMLSIFLGLALGFGASYGLLRATGPGES